MAANTILTYGGATPASAVLGVNPRDLSEFDSAAQSAQSNDDALERSIRQRLIAKSCILRAFVELRLSEANQTRPQQVDETDVVPGSAVEVCRAPDSKAGDGWRGPAKLLDIIKDTSPWYHTGDFAMIKNWGIKAKQFFGKRFARLYKSIKRDEL